ncbi:MAG TPA: putative peptidoglycan glycosyltransferase FtsW [Clostridiales bacterium]|nr:putative peptidoglycan glycosyltransferase FtsW [Clostridiales bacterium]HQP69466.1 putative peptidoglycan glycosyltransferase FtsW [Clostridiales bacterium]
MLTRQATDEGTTYDFLLLAMVFILLVFGSIMVMSAGSFIAAEKFNNDNYFISSQLKNAFIALAAFIAGMTLNYKIYNSKILMYSGMAVTVLALAYLLISNHGESIKGAKRWIFGFQPSEIAKNMIVFYFAYSLDKYRDVLDKFLKGYVFHLVILCAIVGMVFLQPAFSTSMMIFAIGYSMFYVAGMKLKHLLSSMLLLIPVIIAVAIMQPYRMDRIKTFFEPDNDISGKGWQVEQSLIGFGNGGIDGVGLGESRQKEFYLPEPHNDFIFSIIGDELGIIGTALLVLCYIVIMLRGFRIASRAPDYYGFILASGITLTILIYSVFNMCITLGLVPPTGLPLPLVSYGGTSLIMTMFSMGVLLNISYKSKTDAS